MPAKTETTIMLVDDDKITNFVNERYIKKYDPNIKVSSFMIAREALHALINEEKPDVIFLDINMPEMDGWGFLDECTLLKIPIKVFMLSSSIDTSDFERAKEYSMVSDFISKPLTVEKLQTALGE